MIPATRLARPRWWPGVVAWVLWALTMLGIPVIAWLDQLSRQAGLNQTMQPTTASLWLRPSQPASSPAGGRTGQQ